MVLHTRTHISISNCSFILFIIKTSEALCENHFGSTLSIWRNSDLVLLLVVCIKCWRRSWTIGFVRLLELLSLTPSILSFKVVIFLLGFLSLMKWWIEGLRKKKELLLFKVDFEKDFELVDCNYLDVVMRKMNFPIFIRCLSAWWHVVIT